MWVGLPKRNTQKTIDVVILWLETMPAHHSWPYVWENVLKRKEDRVLTKNVKIKLLQIGKGWVKGTLRNRPENSSLSYVYDRILNFDRFGEDRSDLIELISDWLKENQDSKSWPWLWISTFEAYAKNTSGQVNMDAFVQDGFAWIMNYPVAQNPWYRIFEKVAKYYQTSSPGRAISFR